MRIAAYVMIAKIPLTPHWQSNPVESRAAFWLRLCLVGMAGDSLVARRARCANLATLQCAVQRKMLSNQPPPLLHTLQIFRLRCHHFRNAASATTAQIPNGLGYASRPEVALRVKRCPSTCLFGMIGKSWVLICAKSISRVTLQFAAAELPIRAPQPSVSYISLT